NVPRFIVSDTFNFWIPIGVYVAMRALDDVSAIDVWLRRIIIVAVPAQLAYTIWAVWMQWLQVVSSAGLPFFVLFPTWFLHEGSIVGVAASLVLIAATRKRALIVATVFVVALFAFLARRKRLVAVAAAIAVAFALSIAAIPKLRDRFTILAFETGNFTNLQVRQDELNGIAREVRERDWPLSLVIGEGMGATYRLDVGETGHRAKVFFLMHYHDTHISPAGWFLRTGILGTLVYGAFFLTGAYLCIRATRDSRDAALTSSYIGMLALSLTTFSVPSLPIVPMVMMLVLARRRAPQSRRMRSSPRTTPAADTNRGDETSRGAAASA